MVNALTIPRFDKARVVVYGDVMLDQYWYGDVSRISPEAPVPVVHVKKSELRPGGAANVARNIAALGVQVSLLGLVGQDQEADLLRQVLKQKNLRHHLISLTGYSTVMKLRVMGHEQQLIRMDFEKSFHDADDQALMAYFKQQLSEAQVVVFSDYAKGTLHQVAQLIEMARQQNVLTLVDPKSTDFARYRGASLITPNLKEFESVVGASANHEQIIQKARDLIAHYDFGALLVTCGKEGMVLVERAGDAFIIPARAREVHDVTGAGDTVIGVIASALAAGESLSVAAELANLAAGVVVGKLGSATVSVPELRRAIQAEQKTEMGILTEAELLLAVSDARAHGETIVMTNGCFDILHAGHIQYLNEAKTLGHRLIVAVNDDASVRRLKGESRPINSLAERMAVLAALRSVDWVVPFSEDTPARLIGCVLPDVLVKGADYQPHQIAGSDVVMANGGRVQTIKLREGCSTTRVIEQIVAGESV